MIYRNDCRYFLGDRPCRFRRQCGGCPHFEPFGTRILIIKLGASGDVLRTTPLLRALKRRYPQSHVTWLVEPESVPLFQSNPLIDRILTPGLDTWTRLLVERYFLLLCLDKADRATALAMRVQADRKAGFGMTQDGTLCVLNPEAEYALMLGVSDELKFHRNRKSYQQVMFEAAGLEYQGEEYVLEVEDEAAAWAAELGRTLRARGRPVIGIHTGAGPSFAGKIWPVRHTAELARRLHGELECTVLLLGGTRERERNEEIARLAGDAVVDTGSHPFARFAALVDLCDAVVSGDTLSMHVAIARRKQVVALFGSTCAWEIDLYGRGEHVVTEAECSPCYLQTCPIGEICMERISVQRVLEAVQRRLQPADARV
jgi:lipopolysaccharide heptosyltransferase III